MAERDRDRNKQAQAPEGAAPRSAAVQTLAPGKRALTDGVVQNRAAPAGAQAGGQAGGQAGVHAAAARGISGSSTALPYASQIQSLFGRHDISNIQAHTDGAAAEGAQEMGAQAYATGDHVAFGGAPDLHTAAHEAAHVVQQRAGVQLKGGVGESDDAHERHADAVADRVVKGESAEALLSEAAGGSGGGAAVQKKEGKVTHQANAGSGQVTARENDFDPSDKSNTNFSLEYAGKDADKAHWLQFVNFSMFADVPGTGKVYDTDTIATTSGNKPFSTDKVTHWSVDSGSKSDPYYEAAGSNVRTPGKGTKIFDEPGGASIIGVAGQFVTTKAPKATKVTFVANFDTFLVVDNKTIHHVTWSATTEYDPGKKTTGAIAYATGGGSDVKGLPKDFKTVLDTQYAGNKIT